MARAAEMRDDFRRAYAPATLLDLLLLLDDCVKRTPPLRRWVSDETTAFFARLPF